MTVVMPPRRAPTHAFHNKPYCPDSAVRRSTRLAVDRPRPTLTNRRRIPIDPVVLAKHSIPLASSSKRKADSSPTEDDAHGEGSPSISSRRKKRKDNAAVEKPPSQMRATLKNPPRARSSTNKYGTRSAPSEEPVHIINVNPAPVPPQLPSGSPPVSASRQLSPPPPPLPEPKNDFTSEDVPPNPRDAMVTEDTVPEAATPEPVSESCTPEPITTPSYVTYTDLTPFPSDVQQFHVPVPLTPTFSPSILSELHDDFSFPSDPDLDPTALLNPTDVGFPQPLQDQMGTTTVCDNNGSIDVHEWNRVARQKENEEARRQKMANQRRDRLWTNLTDQKYKEFVRNHGMDEVRARVKADTQKAAAAAATARLYQGLNSPVTPSQPTMEAEPTSVLPIRPSFEMYSPDADECEVDEKLDDDDEDDDDSDESIEDDTAPDPNFDLPPPLIVSPLKANPLGGRSAAKHGVVRISSTYR
ncbi:hypothetical protein PILCRDRAFT_93110 [Piloderma croceum F 1598]|uniref:Uncharacterized protein n=1 Tax=Piloderma croceum (strain F 1598) TaxID=765440 RepID=A0A0C3EL20_PILCF|nr:hypothetical protein PILCRDRAFT_93110 [Piloderma croceum F 1598]